MGEKNQQRTHFWKLARVVCSGKESFGLLSPNSILTPARVGNNKILLTKDRRENYLVRIKVAAS